MSASTITLNTIGRETPTHRYLDNQAPVRVEKAIEFVTLCMMKTSPRAAINDLAIEWADPVKLTTEEGNAHAAACTLLRTYFEGTCEPNPQEAARLTQFIEQGKKAASQDVEMDIVAVINCPMCGGMGRMPGTEEVCVMCKGNRRVGVTNAKPAE